MPAPRPEAWGDEQLVPERWVDDGTRQHSDAGADGSYGLLRWVARDGALVPGVALEAGAFAARGNGPHYMAIIPERQLVIVHLPDTETPSPERWVEARRRRPVDRTGTWRDALTGALVFVQADQELSK